MDRLPFSARILRGLDEISPEVWNRLSNPVQAKFDPFLTWEFLQALELSGAVHPNTGWTPCHILVESDDAVVGALPLYVKTHSQGEFVFDYAWADAFERAGGQYYPKLLCGVPFTPVTGRRFLTGEDASNGAISEALVSATIQFAEQNDFSSAHFNFLSEADAVELKRYDLLLRNDQQFHWENREYEHFDDFLATLSSSKRKNLRKERQRAQDGLEFVHKTGKQITEQDWDVFFEFYMDTGSRKWGSPYLNRRSFSLIGERLADKMLLIFALEDGAAIAGALNFIGSDTLYGRYWGCNQERPFLHFETCYYQAIEYAIAHKLEKVEAGAQGGHKLARGYTPVKTWSAHWIAHSGLRDAIDQYLLRERHAVDREVTYLQTHTPYKKDR